MAVNSCEVTAIIKGLGVAEKQAPIVDSLEHEIVSECGSGAALPQSELDSLEQLPNAEGIPLDPEDFKYDPNFVKLFMELTEPTTVDIQVRAPDQLGPLDQHSIAVVVQPEGFRYVSVDDMYAAIYGERRAIKLNVEQSPAKFTMIDGYSMYQRSVRRRAWVERERSQWGELMARPVDHAAYIARRQSLEKRVHRISKQRLALRKHIRHSSDRGHVYFNICIAEQVAELSLLKAFYKSMIATLNVEEASRKALLLGGLDVLKRDVALAIAEVPAVGVLTHQGLDPKSTPFCAFQAKVNAAIVQKRMSAALAQQQQCNGPNGEDTVKHDVAETEVVVHVVPGSAVLQVTRDDRRTSMCRFYLNSRGEYEASVPVSFMLDRIATVHVSGNKNFVEMIRKNRLVFVRRFHDGRQFGLDHMAARLYCVIVPPYREFPEANWFPSAVRFHHIKNPRVIHSKRKARPHPSQFHPRFSRDKPTNVLDNLNTLMYLTHTLGGTIELEGDELKMSFADVPPPLEPSIERKKDRKKAYSPEGKMGGSDAGPNGKGKGKGSAKKITKAEHKAINKAVRKAKKQHKPRNQPKKKTIKTPIGNRKPIVNGIVKGSAKDNQVEVLYTGVDETPKNFDNPWFVFNAQDQIKVMPVSLEGIASAIQVFPNASGQPSQSVQTPPDLLSLMREFTHFRVGKIDVKFESDVASLFGGSMACMYVPSESPTYPATENVNATFDFREMVKAKDHMKVAARVKQRSFVLPQIPGSRECVGPKSLLGYFVVWVREPYTTPNTTGPSSSDMAVVSSTPFHGKIGTFHIECEMLGQYRTYVAQSDRLFRAKTYELPFEPINPQTISQLVSNDALIAPFVVVIPPALALAVADTAALRSGNASRTITMTRESSDLEVQVPIILIPVAEALAAGLGVPPGVATLAIEGVNALLTLGTYVMDAFEDKTFTVQQSNNQLSDGTCGTDLPPVTMSGIATSQMYQAGLTNRTSIVRTPAAYTVDVANSTSTNTTASGLWSTINLLYNAGVRYLMYTWPDEGSSQSFPTETMRVTVYESTDTNVPTLKTVPAPTEVPQFGSSGFAGHTMETFGIPAETFVERLHEDQVGFSYGSSAVFSYPTRQSAVFYQVFAPVVPGPLLAAPADKVIQRTGLYKFSAFPFTRIQQWQNYMGLKILTPVYVFERKLAAMTIGSVFTNVKMAYQLIGHVNPSGDDWVLDWNTSTTFGSTFDTPSPFGVADCRVTITEPDCVISVEAEFLLRDTLGRAVPWVPNASSSHLLYRFVMDF